MYDTANIINEIIPEQIPFKTKLQLILPLFRGKDRLHTHITTDENIEILLNRLAKLDIYNMDRYDGSRLTEVAVRGSVKNEKCILESKDNILKTIQNFSEAYPELIQTPLQTEKSTVHSSSGSYSFDTNFSLIAIEKSNHQINEYRSPTEYLDSSKISKRVGFHHYILFGEPQNDMFIRNSIDNTENIKEYIRESNEIEPEILQDSKEKIRDIYYPDSDVKWMNTFGKPIDIILISKAYARLNQKENVTPETIIKLSKIYDEHLNEEASRFDIDRTSNSQDTTRKDRKKQLLEVINEFEDEGEAGAPKDVILDIMTDKMYDYDESQIEHDLEKFSREGDELFQAQRNEYRTF